MMALLKLRLTSPLLRPSKLGYLRHASQSTATSASSHDPTKRFPAITYKDLCKLYTNTSQAKQRPTPLLRAASDKLSTLEVPRDLPPRIIIQTLNSLVNLTYHRRALIEKLFTDLKIILQLDKVDIEDRRLLLISMSKLGWSDEYILELFYKSITMRDKVNLFDHTISTLLNVSANLNYNGDIVQTFIEHKIAPNINLLPQMTARKHLFYSWSLAVLGYSNESDIRHLFSQERVDELMLLNANAEDWSKLLNLKAIAEDKYSFKKNELVALNQIENLCVFQRSKQMREFFVAIKSCLENLPEYTTNFDVRTNYGFNVDCELHGINQDDSNNKSSIAALLLSHSDVIVNKNMEPKGYKQLLKRMTENRYSKTIFLHIDLVKTETTPDQLTASILSLIDEKADNK